jgi:hypothetical protein
MKAPKIVSLAAALAAVSVLPAAACDWADKLAGQNTPVASAPADATQAPATTASAPAPETPATTAAPTQTAATTSAATSPSKPN